MKVQEPIIKKEECKDFFQNLEDCTNGVFESLISDQQIILESQTIEECIFRKCDFQNIDLKDVNFMKEQRINYLIMQKYFTKMMQVE